MAAISLDVFIWAMKTNISLNLLIIRIFMPFLLDSFIMGKLKQGSNE